MYVKDIRLFLVQEVLWGKSKGDVVCIWNPKPVTDEAIALFSYIVAKDNIIKQRYEDYVEKDNGAFISCWKLLP